MADRTDLMRLVADSLSSDQKLMALVSQINALGTLTNATYEAGLYDEPFESDEQYRIDEERMEFLVAQFCGAYSALEEKNRQINDAMASVAFSDTVERVNLLHPQTV